MEEKQHNTGFDVSRDGTIVWPPVFINIKKLLPIDEIERKIYEEENS